MNGPKAIAPTKAIPKSALAVMSDWGAMRSGMVAARAGMKNWFTTDMSRYAVTTTVRWCVAGIARTVSPCRALAPTMSHLRLTRSTTLPARPPMTMAGIALTSMSRATTAADLVRS